MSPHILGEDELISEDISEEEEDVTPRADEPQSVVNMRRKY